MALGDPDDRSLLPLRRRPVCGRDRARRGERLQLLDLPSLRHALGLLQPPQVRFATENGPTDIYMWGDRKLEFHRCRTCGCITHWSAVDRAHVRMGVNARLMPPEVLAAIPVFHGDGASM